MLCRLLSQLQDDTKWLVSNTDNIVVYSYFRKTLGQCSVRMSFVCFRCVGTTNVVVSQSC